MGRRKYSYIFIYRRRVLTSEYQYSRTNSKGEAVFRRDTNQNLEEVKEYLHRRDIRYESRSKATALKIAKHNADTFYHVYPKFTFKNIISKYLILV